MPDKPDLLSMRLDDVTRDRLDKLAAHFGMNRSNVVRLAVMRLCQVEGIESPATTEEGKAAA